MILLLSHIADMDGITPVILTKLTDIDFEYQLFDIGEINKYLEDRIDNDSLDKYDEIIITDLSVNKEIANKIINSKYKNKFRLFDHHDTAQFLNDYEFATVHEEINGHKECGTTLYFNYLINKYNDDVLKKDSVITFVELVRECDTWQFSDFKLEALDLNNLFSFFGKDYFIENYTKFLKNKNNFYFTELEQSILKSLNNKKCEYLEYMKDKVIIKKVKNYNIGFVFAEQYRSELGHYLCEKYIDKIDFVAIINLNYHISFRGIKDIKINEFAEIYGGGGHPLACAMPLKNNIKDMIINYIYGDDIEN